MKKKIHPVRLVIIIAAVVNLVLGCLFILYRRIPESLIVIGCSVILTALPGLMNPVKQNADGDAADKDFVKYSFVGRCKIGAGESKDCTVCITDSQVLFVSKKDKLAVLSRENIDSVEVANSHTIVMNESTCGECKFICNDVTAIVQMQELLITVA